jgi:hypothetical protein
MKTSRIAKLSRPFVFTFSAFALGACSDEPLKTCPNEEPKEASPCAVQEDVMCPAEPCGPGYTFQCQDGRWRKHFWGCNPPEPAIITDVDARPDQSTSDGGIDGK